ncbi:hypothetical protein [Burkholderia ubonensis]|uniref:hypothetical protein n=1 Tax=Burkholderia ubonensis TaxID=101571 RepID=UPI0015A72F31|nr:hypothetical protein [Burkholderia ubonensis]
MYYGDMVNQDIVDAVRAAKREAAALRAMYDALSPVTRAIAAAQIASVIRLVEAVEAI